MPQFDDIEALVTEINTVTNDEAAQLQVVSDRIDRIIKGIDPNGLDATQAATLKDQLTQIRDAQTPIKDRLTALGKDPENPIP
jgi:hypothetical protein